MHKKGLKMAPYSQLKTYKKSIKQKKSLSSAETLFKICSLFLNRISEY